VPEFLLDMKIYNLLSLYIINYRGPHSENNTCYIYYCRLAALKFEYIFSTLTH